MAVKTGLGELVLARTTFHMTSPLEPLWTVVDISRCAYLLACEECLGHLRPFAGPPRDETDWKKEGTVGDPKDEKSKMFYKPLTHLQEQGMHHRIAISGSLPYYGELIHEEEERQRANGGKQPMEVPKEIAQLYTYTYIYTL